MRQHDRMCGMQLTHRFRLLADVDQGWAALNQIDWLASCFPGASVSEVDGDTFRGALKIKIGPSALVYAGAGRYLERDAGARRVVVETSGDDTRGHGSATSTVTARLVEQGEATEVELVTELRLTGRPATYGDPVVTDAADKAVAQFAADADRRFADGLGPAPVRVEAEQTDLAEDAADPLGADPVELGAVPGDVGDGVRVTAPAQPFVYDPPTDTSRTDLQVFTTILRQFGPILAGLLAALAIVIAVVRRARR